jgi:DNA recombination protein RmuC
LDNYKYLRSAKTEDEIKKYKKLFEEDVLNNVKKISSDYIIAGETTPHAIMFVRSEAVYREISDSNLITKGLEKNVLIVSPSLLWGLLNTLRMFLKDSEMSKKTQVVIKEIGIIGKDIGRLAERVTEVETKFNNIAEQFRGIKVSADKIQSRAEKIQQLESKDEITK